MKKHIMRWVEEYHWGVGMLLMAASFIINLARFIVGE